MNQMDARGPDPGIMQGRDHLCELYGKIVDLNYQRELFHNYRILFLNAGDWSVARP